MRTVSSLRWLSSALALVVSLGLVGTASGQDGGEPPPPDSSFNGWTVTVGSSGVEISANYQGTLPGLPGGNSGSGDATSPASDWTFAPADLGSWTSSGTAENPGYVPIQIYYQGQFQYIVWVPVQPPPSSPPSAGSDPQQVAVSLLDSMPWPAVSLYANPSLGLAGLASWFWASGYDGATLTRQDSLILPPLVGSDVPTTTVPLTDTRRLPRTETIVVTAWPSSSYLWDFGDGGQHIGSLGQPYPQKSDVQHIYADSSVNHPGGYSLKLFITFHALYTVDGGPAIALPDTTRMYQVLYPVQQMQSLLVAPPNGP